MYIFSLRHIPQSMFSFFEIIWIWIIWNLELLMVLSHFPPLIFFFVWQFSFLSRNGDGTSGSAVKLLLPAVSTIKNWPSGVEEILLEARCRCSRKINTACNSTGKRVYKSLFLLHFSQFANKEPKTGERTQMGRDVKGTMVWEAWKHREEI